MKGQRVLVVDDDADTVQLLTSLSHTAGYRVLTALDPSQAVMQAQREQPAPIIVLTASQDPEIEAQSLTAGATRFIRKPWDNAALLDTIKTVLSGEGER